MELTTRLKLKNNGHTFKLENSVQKITYEQLELVLLMMMPL